MDDFLNTKDAAKIAKMDVGTIRIWCERYGIGILVGGRWRIDPEKLDLMLRGELSEKKKD